MNVVFVFAGQGSQFFGMGSRLYQDDPRFRRHLDEVTGKILEITGKDVSPVMMDMKRRSEKFDDLTVSSYAIFAFEYAAAKMMMDLGVKPDAVIGCSLGEIAAQVIAGAMTVEEAIGQIHRHEMIFYGLRESGCCMLAVGAAEAEIDLAPYPGCRVISVSFDRQFVVSGPAREIEDLSSELRKRNVPFLELPVRFPFHTECMDSFREIYLKEIAALGLGERKPACRMYSCALRRQVTVIDDQYRWKVLREKIGWKEAVNLAAGDNSLFVDLSADGELAASLRHLLPDSGNVYRISSPFNAAVNVDEIAQKILEKGGKALKAYVFPGQGSQVKGMGADLFDAFPELTRKADEILGYSIRELCLEDPRDELNNTRYTQPALFTVCALGYLQKMQNGEEKPDYVAGHSLGEYSALFASGVLDFETGLRLVKRRGELMSQAEGGGMAAVVGLSREQVQEILEKNGLKDVDIANLNTPNQIVLSGMKEDIAKAEPVFTAAEGCIMYKVLNVSGAFHSRYMAKAREEFDSCLKEAKFGKIGIPVVANVTARPYREGEIAELLSRQLVSSVHWTDSIRYMMAKGVESYEEIGPGHVAIGMVKKIQRLAKPLDAAELEKEERLEAEKAKAQPPRMIEEKKAPAPEQKPAAEEAKTAELGSAAFRKTYGLRHSYIAGCMGHGISGAEMLLAAQDAGILAVAGTDGLSVPQIRSLIAQVRAGGEITQAFHLSYDDSEKREKERIGLYLQEGVHILAVSGYSTVNRNLVRYRLTGLTRDGEGRIVEKNHIIACVSRTDVAEGFMSPAPERIVQALLRDHEITEAEAELSRYVPLSRDICAQADGGGYTSRGNPFTVLPAIREAGKRMTEKNGYPEPIRVGVSGGIGTGSAAAAAFLMGADFIVTGSVNQCTAEAHTSERVKEQLASVRIQDTGYISAGDPYDPDRAIQVLKKGTLFKARAEKLLRICQGGETIRDIDDKTKEQLESRYFGQSLQSVFEEISREDPEARPDGQLALLHGWYLKKSVEWAMEGNADRQADFQIMCGPALGAFNEWVSGTELASGRNRTVGKVAERILQGADEIMRTQLKADERG